MNVLERFEPYLLAVINNQVGGFRASFLRGVLTVLSKVYAVGIKIRVFLYQHRIFRNKSLGCKVISVGNITVGGTGKTPVVEMLARELIRNNRKVALLSRGYKSEKKGANLPKVVSDGNNIMLDVISAGDEPYMLARSVKNAVVIIDKDRVRSAKYAIRKFNTDTIILDDGYQYLRLARQVNIVLIDCTNPFGNHHLLPRGVLREPIENLNRADIFFLTKTGGMDLQGLKGRLKRINPAADIIECAHKPRYLNDVFSATKRDLNYLAGKRIACVSGIASPRGFEQLLTDLGAIVTSIHRFPDHHMYTKKELEHIVQCAHTEKADALVTTEKDAVRFPKIDRPKYFFLYYLRVEIEILSGAKSLYEKIG